MEFDGSFVNFNRNVRIRTLVAKNQKKKHDKKYDLECNIK